MCKPIRTVLIAITLLTTLTTARHAAASDYDVYLLAGQSNMDGYGKTAELPDDLKGPQKGVMIFHGSTAGDGDLTAGRGIWATLQPGHGGGFTSDGKTNKYSERFGPEIGFAARMRALRPDRNVAIIKYSRGGTSIAIEARGRPGCWHPDFDLGEGDARGVNQYDHCLTTIRNAFSHCDIDGDGESDTLQPAGIVWMQGESDAYLNDSVAKAYQANLARLMGLLSAALRKDQLPVAIGRISDSGRDEKDGKVWDYGDIVRAAQQHYTDSHRNAALVTSTDAYGYSDPWHYDSPGYINLGKRFAEAIAEKSESPSKRAEGTNAEEPKKQ